MEETKKPHFIISLIPIIVLLTLLVFNIKIYGDATLDGSNQLALFISSFVCIAIGVFGYKKKYELIEKKIVESITMSAQAILILLLVGVIISIWILSGIVPGLIYYGLFLLSPQYFLPAACLICLIVSTATGSSWSTAGTIGIALMGIGKALGIPDGMVAGAIISGSYFGDKMSPLSDTTNLAPAVAGTDVFTHIRHMVNTTLPSIIIALVGFTILSISFQNDQATIENIYILRTAITQTFNINPLIFLVPLLVVFLVIKKVPALPSLVVGVLGGILVALILQKDLLHTFFAQQNLPPTIFSYYKQIMYIAYQGFEIQTDHELMNVLFNRGGMASMLNTVWLILMAMVFGGSMEGTGMLQVVAEKILSLVRNAGSLVAATLASTITMNILTSDQYISIVLPGRMFKSAYEKFNLHPKNLSRALEDAGTLSSVLIPWNSCAAYISGVLQVSPLTFIPYCFFNITNILIATFYAGFGINIVKLPPTTEKSLD
ncbi:MAG TPA: Na+/H+ antiporter NhaC [Planctomycetota bacterium]|nr:Na+/H+ antiporter NhaC [Planctomycetota bacterium]